MVAGNAVHASALAVRDRARQVGARMLEVAPDDLDVHDGVVSVAGDPLASVTLAEVARATAPASRYLRPGEQAGLSARRRFDVSHMTYPYGVHIAVVEVDPGTGRVQVLRYLVAYEVGRAVNPAMVEGQLRGGAAQGIGGALLEELCYDESGEPRATTLMDYRMPTAAEIPRIELLVAEQAPAPGNPLGVRGAGEAASPPPGRRWPARCATRWAGARTSARCPRHPHGCGPWGSGSAGRSWALSTCPGPEAPSRTGPRGKPLEHTLISSTYKQCSGRGRLVRTEPDGRRGSEELVLRVAWFDDKDELTQDEIAKRLSVSARRRPDAGPGAKGRPGDDQPNADHLNASR